ncbi:hypothetical protein ACH4ZX_35250 [Streptomyces sp. NPDC020490]|uniref:hypothetical protein n=1 Tax=Streptomyces sp. NPDC020490 TaxID=3365078 RepID=UPI00379F8D34
MAYDHDGSADQGFPPDDEHAMALYEHAIGKLREARSALGLLIERGPTDHDERVPGLPSANSADPPGGARVEAAFYASNAAVHLLYEAVGQRKSGLLPPVERAQADLGMALGYVSVLKLREVHREVWKDRPPSAGE